MSETEPASPPTPPDLDEREQRMSQCLLRGLWAYGRVTWSGTDQVSEDTRRLIGAILAAAIYLGEELTRSRGGEPVPFFPPPSGSE